MAISQPNAGTGPVCTRTAPDWQTTVGAGRGHWYDGSGLVRLAATPDSLAVVDADTPDPGTARNLKRKTVDANRASVTGSMETDYEKKPPK